MTTPPSNTVINRREFHWLVNRIHARKLYLAEQFRMFDEADYNPDETPVYEAIRAKKNPLQAPADEPPASVLDATTCRYKNVLKNGVVVGACESRFDHYVRLVISLNPRSSLETW